MTIHLNFHLESTWYPHVFHVKSTWIPHGESPKSSRGIRVNFHLESMWIFIWNSPEFHVESIKKFPASIHKITWIFTWNPPQFHVESIKKFPPPIRKITWIFTWNPPEFHVESITTNFRCFTHHVDFHLESTWISRGVDEKKIHLYLTINKQYLSAI